MGLPSARAFLSCGHQMLGMVKVHETPDGRLFAAHPQPSLPEGTKVTLRFRTAEGRRIARAGTVVSVVDARREQHPSGYRIEVDGIRAATPPAGVPAQTRERTPRPASSIRPIALEPVPLHPAPVHSTAAKMKPRESKLVMVVDRHRELAASIDTWLSGIRRSSRHVRCGRDALSELDRAPADYDLAVVDCQLGDVDGVQLIAMMRERRRDLPIVATSGALRGVAAIQMRAKEAGASTFVAKPYDKETLCRAVLNLVGAGDRTPETSNSLDDDAGEDPMSDQFPRRKSA